MDATQENDVLKTYHYLWLAMVLLVGLLAAAVLWQVFRNNPRQPKCSLRATR